MSGDLHQYLKRKKRKRRIWTLLILTAVMASTAVLVRECNQSLDQPYNNEYRPLDQADKVSVPRDLR
ncbi:MAG: hypothetical protein R8M45_09785 [Ghiorsea sp.]